MALSSTRRIRGVGVAGVGDGGVGGGLEVMGDGLGFGAGVVGVKGDTVMLAFRARSGRTVVGAGRSFCRVARIREMLFCSLRGPHGPRMMSTEVARGVQADFRASWSKDWLQSMSKGGSVAGSVVTMDRSCSSVRRMSMGCVDGHETSSRPYHCWR